MIPYGVMLVPFSVLGLVILFCFFKGVHNFWKLTEPASETLSNRKGNLSAFKDVLKLKYLEGGGHGCNYPTDGFSHIRRYFHHAVFYGFLACLAATTIAAIYDHLFHIPAPYDFFSLPVLFGTGGGIAIVVGTAGLLYLKSRMDRRPATEMSSGMDVGFGLLLMLTSLSGLLLLALRETPLMGTMLILHIGLVLAFFLTMPFGKFVHGIYRYIALVRHNQEQSRPDEAH